MNAVILIVDDEPGIRHGVKSWLTHRGHEVHVASDGEQGLEQFELRLPDLLLVDLLMPKLDGAGLIRRVRERDGCVPILAMTSYGCVESVVGVMKCGADDLLEKPLEAEVLLERVAQMLEQVTLRKEVLQFHPALGGDALAGGRCGDGGTDNVLLGRSAEMRSIYATIKRLSRSASTTVLVEGESGTGKELVARAIHATSARRHKPFVAVNCAALSESLLESELFGYEKGAFTGAAATGKAGLFEAADGGTIFLDEIGEMGFNLQAKLLRVLEDKKFIRVGGTQNISVDIRVVASTNRHLTDCVREGVFRQDLFFRLNVVTIHTPALRDRREDILPLAKYFLDRFSREFHRRLTGFTPEAEKLLLSYPWPGNVRELKNAMESCVILETGSAVSARHLRLDAACVLRGARTWAATEPLSGAATTPGGEGDRSLAALERQHILHVLNETMWQRGRTAKILGIHRTTLANKIREYGLADGPAAAAAEPLGRQPLSVAAGRA